MKIRVLLFALSFILVLNACTYNKGEEIKPIHISGLTYNNSIKKIMERRCYEVDGDNDCHNASTGRSFDTYAGATDAYYISKMSDAINHSSGAIPMPYPAGSAKLPQAEIDSIDSWIIDGYPEN